MSGVLLYCIAQLMPPSLSKLNGLSAVRLFFRKKGFNFTSPAYHLNFIKLYIDSYDNLKVKKVKQPRHTVCYRYLNRE